MFEISVGTTPCDLTPTDFRTLGQLSEGYTGSDITIAVQDALMQPVRKIQAATHYKWIEVAESETNEETGESKLIKKKKLTPCSPGDKGAIEMSWTEVEGDQLAEPPLVLKDFVKAVKNSRPTVSKDDIKKSNDWTAEFGSEGA